MSEDHPYRLLAARLDELPNGFPATADGAELRLLAKLFTPEEAALVAGLRLTLETPAEIDARLSSTTVDGLAALGARLPSTAVDGVTALGAWLKSMARRGLIKAGRTERGVGYGLLPFVVGIYEMQTQTMDAELARLFEDYYCAAFGRATSVQPPLQRVIPIAETVRVGMELHPYESAAGIVAASRAWGVVDCVCRTQRALFGEACGHPLDVCMMLGPVPGMFDGSSVVKALSEAEAMATLRRAADAGLVHSVTNTREGTWYICNCCTCSCGVLRGLAELGVANVVARSAFVNQVDEDACGGCGTCVDRCQFGALTLEEVVRIDEQRCAGCGVCVPACPEDALHLVRRPEADVLPIPDTEADWRAQRAAARGLDLTRVL